MRFLLGLIAGFNLGCATVAAATAPPKLVVLVVVDQMRADYVDRFVGDWTAGLKRLVSKGAWFRRAAYPYLDTVTCAGHATIATGAFPAAHGVFQNAWFDRDTRALVTCTEDTRVASVAYGKAVIGGESPTNLRLPSLADQMRQQRDAHVVSLSLKARSAVMMAGHGGDAVTWLSDTSHGWKTSTAFSDAPVVQVQSFVSAHPIEADYGRSWTRLLTGSHYREPDRGRGEAPPAGWTASFPHPLSGAAGSTSADLAFYAQWERSPYADAYLGRMAAALVESMGLGGHDGVDLLAISFSSPDLVGHAFGPRSQEIRDMYAHLDRTVGALLEVLDRVIGPDKYVVGLTSDHGVTDIPEQRIADHRDGGRLDSAGIAKAIEQAAEAALGPGRYLARMVGNHIYFEPGKYDALASSASALASVANAIRSQPGVGRVFQAADLAGTAARGTRDVLLRAAALSYVPGRSGDIIMSPKAGWMIGATGTTHGSANDDDQRVPMIFLGAGIKPGRYNDPATPADLAPTLAAIVGITMPDAQGKPLERALRNPAPAGVALPIRR